MLDDLRLAIALRGALRTEDRRVYEQELQEWELAPGFCSALLRLYASPPAQFGVPERLLAVLCLKNAVARRWQRRGVDEGSGGLADSEKAAVRAALLAALDEPEAQLAAQLLLVLAQVARLDGLAAWPELMPSLLHAAARTAPRDAARGTFALFRVVKMQASRRLLVHRKQFIVLAAELSPRLQPLRARLHGLLQAIRCRSLHEAAAWLCGGDGSGGDGAPAVGVEAALALCKLDRQLLSAGWAQLHGSAEACALLREYVELLAAADAEQRRLAAAAPHTACRVLQPLLLQLAKLLLEVQELHPLAFGSFVPRLIAVAHEQVITRLEARPPGATDAGDNGGGDAAPADGGGDGSKYTVRLMLLLRNTLCCSSYDAGGRLPHAVAPAAARASYFASPALTQLCVALVSRGLLLTAEDVSAFEAEPEGSVFEEGLVREVDSLRKCAESCLHSLAEVVECAQPVQAAVLDLAQHAAGRAPGASLEHLLALDASFAALGLVITAGAAQSIASPEQITRVLSALQEHCAASSPDHAHLLRRRAAWLLGYVLRLPQYTALGAGASAAVAPAASAPPLLTADGGSAADSAAGGVALWYGILTQLLGDAHLGVRLTAAAALRQTVEAIESSPRAHASLDASPPAVDGGEAPPAEPTPLVAQLAGAALLPVMQTTLAVSETDARWRLVQLIARLLARLGGAAHCAAPHADAMALWLRAAWQASDGEQLLLEAVIDVAASMVTTLRPAPPSLLRAALELVDAATQSAAAEHAAGAEHPAGARYPAVGPGLHALALALPGIHEQALRLWRAVLAGLAPPVGAVEGGALATLAARLPAVVSLGDELFRPAMLVVDWYLLHDRQYGAAGGSFVVTHAAALAALLDAALITNVGGRGALSAVATAHVVLLCASEHNASVLRAALVHALVVLIGGAADAAADEHSDLLLASFAGLLGRCLLCAPALFSAALGGAAEALRIPDPLPRLDLGDSVLLSRERKLASLALATALQHDAAVLPLATELLSYAVSVIEELEPPEPSSPPRSPPREPRHLRAGAEHADFYRALDAAALDPLPELPLRPALQAILAQCAVAHGEAFAAQMAALDPALLEQVQRAFGPPK